MNVIQGGKSLPTSTGIQITFNNLAHSDLDIHWVDFNGNSTKWATVNAESKISSATYVHHLWEIREPGSGKLHLRVVGTKDGQVFDLSTLAFGRSLQTRTATKIKFVNGTAFDSQIYWVDWNGELKPYQVLKAGQEYVQDTYIDHLWEVREFATQQFMARVAGKKNAQTVQIKVRLVNDSTITVGI